MATVTAGLTGFEVNRLEHPSATEHASLSLTADHFSGLVGHLVGLNVEDASGLLLLHALNITDTVAQCNRNACIVTRSDYNGRMIETVPKPVVMTIRIPPDVLDQVKALAEIETRSVNGELVQLVKEALAARAKN